LKNTDAKEFEVSFVYGVESSQSSYDYIIDMEDWILYYVSKSTTCVGERKPSSNFLRNEAEEVINSDRDAGLVEVRYPPDGEVSHMVACDPRPPRSHGCAVWHTRILITSVGLSMADVQYDTLILLSNYLNNGTFIQDIPDVISTTYLGPNPDAQTILREEEPVHDDISPPESEGTSDSVSLLVLTLIGITGVVLFPII